MQRFVHRVLLSLVVLGCAAAGAWAKPGGPEPTTPLVQRAAAGDGDDDAGDGRVGTGQFMQVLVSQP